MNLLASGEAVIDRFNSHNHVGVSPLLPEALAKIDSKGRQFLVEEVVFDHIIGETVCVATGPGDEIVYAKRPKRWGLTRFVRNRKPEPCSAMTVILKRDDYEPYYVLITAFVGHRPEPEPWDRNANGNSRAFWSSHALVWGCEEVIDYTITTACPW